MVNLDQSVRCFHAIVLSYSALRGPFEPGELLVPGHFNKNSQTDLDKFRPVNSVEDLTAQFQDLTNFQMMAVQQAWAAQNFHLVPEMLANLIAAKHDYSPYFTTFSVTPQQCLGSDVSFKAIGDKLARDNQWTAQFGSRKSIQRKLKSQKAAKEEL